MKAYCEGPDELSCKKGIETFKKHWTDCITLEKDYGGR